MTINRSIKKENFYKCTNIKCIYKNTFFPLDTHLKYNLFTNRYLEIQFDKNFTNSECMLIWPNLEICLIKPNNNKIIIINSVDNNAKVGDYVYCLDNMYTSWLDTCIQFEKISKEEWWEFLSNVKDPDTGLINFIINVINGAKQ